MFQRCLATLSAALMLISVAAIAAPASDSSLPSDLAQQVEKLTGHPLHQDPTSGPSPAQAPQQPPLSLEAFSKTTQSMFPMTPGQIKALRRYYNAAQRAAAGTGDVPPKPTASMLTVNLSPGATPPVIRLSSGFISSLVFLDATGAPWPIHALDVGDPNAFNVQWHQAQGKNDSMANTLMIQPTTMYRQGNLAVLLQGLNTPIMLTLIPGQRVIDYRVDVRIPRNGPHAFPVVSTLPEGASNALLDVLNGLSPAGAKRLKLRGSTSSRAWLLEDRMLVRTPNVVISPSWTGHMASADQAMHAYQLPPTSTVLTLHHGRVVPLHIKGL